MSLPTSEQGPKPLVLVVDDEEVVRLLARKALEGSSFAVTEAENGLQALEIFREMEPDTVLLDVKMPEMDGFTACRHLRALPAGRHTPILMMTGLDDVESIERAFEVGATDFVNKPINWLVLGHRMEYMLRADRSARELRESRTRLANAQRIAKLGYWEWKEGSDQIDVSQETAKLFGIGPSTSSIGLSRFLELIHEQDRDLARRQFESLDGVASSSESEYRIVLPDGGLRSIHQQTEAVTLRGGGQRLTSTVQDVTEHKQAEETIRRLAYHDGLTGLPNRRAFHERLSLGIASVSRQEGRMAVLYLDLDRFKRINETLGPKAGDRLLKEIGDRLVSSVRETDYVGRGVSTPANHLVARFGGDEFFILLSEISDSQDAALVARRINETLAQPLSVRGQEIFVTASIGIAISPDDGQDADRLLRNTETAMYHAKEQGGNGHRFYSPAMNARAMERFLLEGSLRRALEREEFVLHYQPQIDIATGRIIGAEALVRWHHPKRGLLPPGTFIATAEETGLIVPLGEWVLRTACAQAKAWHDAGHSEMRVSVNLSSRQFELQSLPATLSLILRETGLDPAHLDLELTESIIMQDGSESIRSLEALKRMGVSLSVDDFGTGYSSLSYLKRFPLDALKVDRSFLAGVPEDPDHVAITSAIIAMAKRLKLRVVAEGVETQEQRHFLADEGCEEAQGFLFSRPVGAEELDLLLTDE